MLVPSVVAPGRSPRIRCCRPGVGCGPAHHGRSRTARSHSPSATAGHRAAVAGSGDQHDRGTAGWTALDSRLAGRASSSARSHCQRLSMAKAAMAMSAAIVNATQRRVLNNATRLQGTVRAARRAHRRCRFGRTGGRRERSRVDGWGAAPGHHRSWARIVGVMVDVCPVVPGRPRFRPDASRR